MEEDIADSKVENICDIYIPTFYLIDLHSIIHRFLKFSLLSKQRPDNNGLIPSRCLCVSSDKKHRY